MDLRSVSTHSIVPKVKKHAPLTHPQNEPRREQPPEILARRMGAERDGPDEDVYASKRSVSQGYIPEK
jgi:hypothetical protein